MKILYHSPCFDGFCAAWLLHGVYPDAEFIPINYGKQQDEFISNVDNYLNKDLIIADFSFSRVDMLRVMYHCQSLVVLDHHKSAKEELKNLPQEKDITIIFDMEKSGARLVQHYYMLSDYWLIDYTEDRDLWRWKLPNSRAISAGLRLHEFDFDIWEKFIFSEILLQGEIILKYLDLKIKNAINNAKTIKIGGHFVLAVNCTNSDILSDIAGQLADQTTTIKDANENFISATASFGATYFYTIEEGFIFSLRSRGDFDVSEIAKKYGGGGHKNAAGFGITKLEEL